MSFQAEQDAARLLADLRAQNVAFKEEAAAARGEGRAEARAEVRQELVELRADLARATAQLAEVRPLVDIMLEVNTDLEAHAAALSAMKTDLRRELDRVKSANDALTKEIFTLREELARA